MADNQDMNTPVGGAPEASDQPQAGLVVQYVKDLSFENPNAPGVYQVLQNQRPQIDVNVNLNVGQGPNDMFEVELMLKATGTIKGEDGNDLVAFVSELTYAGLFGVRNLPDETRNQYLAITAPTLLFPFARRVMADAMRDGNFPPLLLEPINFAALFQARQQQAAQEAAGGQGAASGADAPAPTEIN